MGGDFQIKQLHIFWRGVTEARLGARFIDQNERVFSLNTCAHAGLCLKSPIRPMASIQHVQVPSAFRFTSVSSNPTIGASDASQNYQPIQWH